MHHRRLALLLALLPLAACTGPGYRYSWQPPTVALSVAGDDGAVLAALGLSVPGQWHGDAHDGELRVLITVDNVGHSPLQLPLDRCELLLADGTSCGPARPVGTAPGTLAPGASAIVELGFMPPSSDADLQHLMLRWVLVVDGHDVPGSQQFDRDQSRDVRYGGIKVSAADGAAGARVLASR